MKKLKKSLEKSSDITMTIKQEKLTNKIIELQEDYDYLKMTMEATQLMLNFAKGQVDAYEKILGVNIPLDCNQDYCNGQTNT